MIISVTQLTHVLFAFSSLRFLVTRFPLSSFSPLGMNTLSFAFAGSFVYQFQDVSLLLFFLTLGVAIAKDWHQNMKLPRKRWLKSGSCLHFFSSFFFF